MPTDKEVGIRRIPAYTLHYTTECESNPSDGWILLDSSGIGSVCGPNKSSSRATWQRTLHRTGSIHVEKKMFIVVLSSIGFSVFVVLSTDGSSTQSIQKLMYMHLLCFLFKIILTLIHIHIHIHTHTHTHTHTHIYIYCLCKYNFM